MAYYNPFQMGQYVPQNPFAQSAMPKIDPARFQQMTSTLNQDSLTRLVQMAKMNGISDNDIQDGLNIIKSIR